MADLSINFAGIRSPNPFWLASAPPTNSGAQVHRAFEAGWGGAVWKTIGAPVLNVSNRYGAWHYGSEKMLAINNVELISDRPLEVNLREIAEVKRAWPDRAVIVSAMVESKPEAWHDIIQQNSGHGRGRHRAELRLSARDERARHGQRGGPGAASIARRSRLGHGGREDSGDREADAEHYEHRHAGAGGGGRRRECDFADQHDQFDYRRGSGHVGNHAEHRRARADTAVMPGRR